jgi:hypothetical protein
VHRDRGRVRGIDQEERLDPRVGELVDLLVGVLPGVAAVRHPGLRDVDGLEVEILQAR